MGKKSFSYIHKLCLNIFSFAVFFFVRRAVLGTHSYIYTVLYIGGRASLFHLSFSVIILFYFLWFIFFSSLWHACKISFLFLNFYFSIFFPSSAGFFCSSENCWQRITFLFTEICIQGKKRLTSHISLLFSNLFFIFSSIIFFCAAKETLFNEF